MPKKKKEQLYYIKSRQTEKEYLVAICDEELLGETVCEDDLELFISERFFGGELVTLEKCLEELEKATTCNLFGESIVDEAVKRRIVCDIAVKWINCPKNGRVGHVMLMR